MILVTAAFTLFSACQKKQQQESLAASLKPELKAEMIKQGNQASAALFNELAPKLQAAMQSGGPEKAITVCKEVAQSSTLNTSKTFSRLHITRISSKPRNPENAASEFDLKTLNEWDQRMASSPKLPDASIKMKDANTAVFYKPIVTGEICLKCHGDPLTLPVELKEKLHSLYPNDLATGYKTGEIRGAFRVEFPLQQKND